MIEIMIDADVQKRLLTVIKHSCVPHLIVKCIKAKSVTKDTSGFKF